MGYTLYKILKLIKMSSLFVIYWMLQSMESALYLCTTKKNHIYEMYHKHIWIFIHLINNFFYFTADLFM